MVKPDAASHSGIRHVRPRTLVVPTVGGWPFLPTTGKGTSHLGCVRTGNEVMPSVGSTRLEIVLFI
jgi:hypothetical protein